MKKFQATLALAAFSVLLIGTGYAMGQDRVVSEEKMGNDLEVSTICVDNKVFLVVKSKEEMTGIKQGGVGVGLGLTQVLEERNGVLLPKTCE